MRAPRKPKLPAPREHEVQAAIVDVLRLAGFVVLETTAYRQKGTSGVDEGIPDLLVYHPHCGMNCLGLEVKRSEKAPRRPAQVAMADQGFYPFVWSPLAALKFADDWYRRCFNPMLSSRLLAEHLGRIDRIQKQLGGQ